MTLPQSREAGEQASQACLDFAQHLDPDFPEKARTAILEHLRVVRRCSGEELVNIATAKGARAHDARAYGGIFSSLARAGLIRQSGSCLREKGHGTAGGRIWEICA
jgi:hypothetical protein